MWRMVLIVLSLTLPTFTIKVPIYGKDDNVNATDVKPLAETPEQEKENLSPIGIFYEPENVNIDSYLIPPNPHVPEEVLPDYIVTPATYLLPPALDKQTDYYASSTENGQQTDWYPIQLGPVKKPSPVKILPQNPPVVVLGNNRTFEIVEKPRHGKVYEQDLYYGTIPSRQLIPPPESAPSDYEIPIPSKDLELPLQDTNSKLPNELYLKFNQKPVPKLNPKFRKYLKKENKPEDFLLKPVDATLALHLTPPKPYVKKIPTNLFPKKVAKGFQPVPIPVAQYAEETPDLPPLAKPVKLFNPGTTVENEYFASPDEKKLYISQQVEQKRKLKHDNDAIQQQHLEVAAEDTYGDNVSAEPETSETNYRHPDRNAYPVPLRNPPPSAPAPYAAQAPAERTEFRMHGMNGPHSYQFGYDTGKGKNRQFRYEERDNEGRVKGHYGYVDKDGKLRVVNYDADPEHGFHAESPRETE